MQRLILYASFGFSVVALIFSGALSWFSGEDAQPPLQTGLNALTSGNVSALFNILPVISALFILAIALYGLNQHIPRWLILVVAADAPPAHRAQSADLGSVAILTPPPGCARCSPHPHTSQRTVAKSPCNVSASNTRHRDLPGNMSGSAPGHRS